MKTTGSICFDPCRRSINCVSNNDDDGTRINRTLTSSSRGEFKNDEIAALPYSQEPSVNTVTSCRSKISSRSLLRGMQGEDCDATVVADGDGNGTDADVHNDEWGCVGRFEFSISLKFGTDLELSWSLLFVACTSEG